jgi:hypothetical protein
MKNGKRASLLFVVGMLLLGAMIGGLFGELIKLGLPGGVVKEVLLRHIPIGFQAITIELAVIQFTFGFMFKVNIISMLGIVVAYYMLRYWR